MNEPLRDEHTCPVYTRCFNADEPQMSPASAQIPPRPICAEADDVAAHLC